MPVLELMTSSGLGSLLGMRHALEPDHLAAVTTLVTGERGGYKAAFLGTCWGLGHTLALLVAGTVLVLLRAEMPARDGRCLRILRRAHADRARPARDLPGGAAGSGRSGARPPSRPHVHVHQGAPAHIHIGTWTLARRPLLVGAVHGLAGSGALTALVVTTLPTTGGAAHLHGRVRSGIDAGDGGAVRPARLAARARRPAPPAGARPVARVGCVSTVLGLVWGYPLMGRVF